MGKQLNISGIDLAGGKKIEEEKQNKENKEDKIDEVTEGQLHLKFKTKEV